MTYRELRKAVKGKGWFLLPKRGKGSHEMYAHPEIKGPPLVIPGSGKPGQDVPPGTLDSILKAAGLKLI
jgi:predicted RNA binding protein YcfA (HicA-like mRNA interferase family)